VPQQVTSIPQALVQSQLLGRPSDRFRVERAVALRRAVSRPIFARHLVPGSVEFIDTIAALCPGAHCAIVRDGRPLYYDDNHLSTFGAATLTPLLRASLLAGSGGDPADRTRGGPAARPPGR
jgi:hypothetical protein